MKIGHGFWTFAAFDCRYFGLKVKNWKLWFAHSHTNLKVFTHGALGGLAHSKFVDIFTEKMFVNSLLDSHAA